MTEGSARPRRTLLDRVKLLPVLIFVAALLLTVKVNDIWTTIRSGRTAVTVATVAEAEPTKAPKTGSEAAKPEPMQLAQASSQGGAADKKEDTLDPVLFTRSEIELLQELSKRRKELDIREQTVIQKEGLLAAAEDRLEKRISELTKIRAEIESLIKKYDEQEENQFKDLVNIYEKMKPKDAARIFDELDMDVLLQVVSRMKSSKTAVILANMRPARAKEITSRIAERREMPKIE